MEIMVFTRGNPRIFEMLLWNSAQQVFVESSQRELEVFFLPFQVRFHFLFFHSRACITFQHYSLEMEKGKRVETVTGEIPLPEAMIQHVQSFLSGKEAARTTLLSRSWYNAWLTRPALDLDEHDFRNRGRESSRVFEEFATETMQRYQRLSLKIESFRLSSINYQRRDIARNWIVSAMEMGATNVKLEFPPSFTLPQEVLGSETLLKLSLTVCGLDGDYHISCSRLKSLSLNSVGIRSDDVLRDIISCCISIEELSLSYCSFLELRQTNMYELHKLGRLYLCGVDVDNKFFNDFASRFPCLKDLSILSCYGCTRIQIASTSLQTISLKPHRESYRAKFDVPNIRKFTYSTTGLPHLSVTSASREWEFDISIASNRFYDTSWFRNLKKLLKKFRLSRISISVRVRCRQDEQSTEHEVDIEVVPDPFVVENLRIDAQPSFCCALLVRLFGIFRPKFLTAMFYPWSNAFVGILYKRLMQQVITPNSGIPDQSMCGQFGLKKVNMEVYDMYGTERRRPHVLEKPLDPSETTVEWRKIRFELIWD